MKKIKILCFALALFLCCAGILSCSKSESEYKVLESTLIESDPYGIGFRLGDDDLTAAVQETIDAMIADGEFKTISERWFGKDVSIADAKWPREIKATGDGSLDYIKNNGKLILGLDESFPPMGYRDDKGEIVGFDIDLAKEVCSRLGVTLVLQPIDWSAKEMELSSKSIDCIWNGMSITDERVAAMNITKPYIINRQIIAVKADSGIVTKEDLAGKKVATQAGSAALEAINSDAEFASSIHLSEYAKYDEAWLDFKAGSVDAIAIDEVVFDYFTQNK